MSTKFEEARGRLMGELVMIEFQLGMFAGVLEMEHDKILKRAKYMAEIVRNYREAMNQEIIAEMAPKKRRKKK